MEIVDSLDEVKSSRSACGKDCPNLEMLDAKIVSARIASALNRIIHNSRFKRRISLEEQNAKII